jgi:hypothetical protein
MRNGLINGTNCQAEGSLVGNSNLVPISGTPIGSGMSIPFLILDIPVYIFIEFRC